jgi:rod shape-determining protein MreC
MNFHPRNKNIFLSIIVIIFFIIVFSLPWTKNILFSMGSPLWTAKNSVSYFFSDNIGVLNSKTNLLKENSLLKDQIGTKNKDQIFYDVLKKENDDLKNILNRKNDSQNFLLSTVLIKPFLSPYDILVIDTGLSNGVSVGDKVLADGNIFIGYVSEVYNNTSKVILYSSPGEKINVLIGNNNIEKEAIGLGGGNFKVEIPREINVKEGDPIVIPSISTNIFGTVEKIEFKESDSFQNILFKNPINIAELKWVEVLLSNKK